MAEGDRRQGRQQAQRSTQRLELAMQKVRGVQNMMETRYPQLGDAIKALREAGDLVWEDIQEEEQRGPRAPATPRTPRSGRPPS